MFGVPSMLSQDPHHQHTEKRKLGIYFIAGNATAQGTCEKNPEDKFDGLTSSTFFWNVRMVFFGGKSPEIFRVIQFFMAVEQLAGMKMAELVMPEAHPKWT